ncbi:MAG: methyltransferase domain-containing protein [Anaerolineaceae bacterium]|nr:methyltransferase domain-containing protein [Anaerolineaceae bacterium]
MRRPESQPKICDYEGSNYRVDFWEGKGRDYEDQVERIALRRLLPGSGRRLLEVGAGFGRLTSEYHAYERVVLLDYSFSQLEYAREKLGDGRFTYVAADAYRLPFRPGTFDGATMIRVIHHMADVPAVMRQIRRVLVPGGIFILEHANKRNIKAMLRYATGRQKWDPYDFKPVEFVELNFDFHPEYIVQQLEQAQLKLETRFPVSFFRVDALKNTVPTQLLVGVDALLQHSGLLVTPSVFTRSHTVGNSADNLNTSFIFVCPDDGDELSHDGDTLVCRQCGKAWAQREGIYDFKAPVNEMET